MIPCTTKRKITTNLKSINNQKCQKMKLHGIPTTTELKKQSNILTKPVRPADGENPSQGGNPAGGAGHGEAVDLSSGAD